jgi:signal transduction histidine kinase
LLNNLLLNHRCRTMLGARLGWRGHEGTASDGPRYTVGWASALIAAGMASLVLPLALRSTAIHAPTLRPALETMLTLFCLSAAWLLRAQFAASRRLTDLLLLCMTFGLGLMNLCVVAVPAALDLRAGAYLAAANVWGQLSMAGIFAAAAAVPFDKVVSRPAYPARIGGVLGLAPLAAATLGGLLTVGLGLDLRVRADGPSEAVLIVLVLGTIGLLVYAAGRFARRGLHRPDRITALLAMAGLVLAGASLSSLTTHSLTAGEVDVATAMRVLATALLLCAAVALERSARARFARAAALAERQRVARDLHDGIAQDLAFIAAHGDQIATEMGEEHPVVVAARRALALSRNAISDLSDPAGATAGEALDAVAQELRDRFDLDIAVHTQIDGHLPSGVREHLSRIAREAIANAARHGQARNVLVSLRHAEGGTALRVLDDGHGIAWGDGGAAPEGFGLRSMRERAGALGGSLTVRQAPHGGTELEVVLP